MVTTISDTTAAVEPADVDTSSGSDPLVLQVVSGKFQGGQFPLVPGKDLIIGRGNDVQVMLAEDMISRRHARITFRNNECIIEDLSSTNGTFINGEKIKSSRLRQGDRVLIGTSILKVTRATMRASVEEQPASKSCAPVSTLKRTTTVRGMTGSLEEISLPDLLQLLGTSRKSGVLSLRTNRELGFVYMQEGLIHFATINDQPEIAPSKCLFRMLSWNQGQFDLDPSNTKTFDHPLDMPVQSALMEGMRQLDEFNSIKKTLPSLTSRLHVNIPMKPALRNLNGELLDVLQLVFNFSSFSQIMNRSKTSDLETARAVLELIQKGYIRIEQQAVRNLPPVSPTGKTLY